MLKYLILVTENTALPAILLGLLYAYIFAEFKQKGHNRSWSRAHSSGYSGSIKKHNKSD